MLWTGFKKLHLQTTSRWFAKRKRQLFDWLPRTIKEHPQGRMSHQLWTAYQEQEILKAWVPMKFHTHLSWGSLLAVCSSIPLPRQGTTVGSSVDDSYRNSLSSKPQASKADALLKISSLPLNTIWNLSKSLCSLEISIVNLHITVCFCAICIAHYFLLNVRNTI